jgi:hypothetical protein
VSRPICGPNTSQGERECASHPRLPSALSHSPLEAKHPQRAAYQIVIARKHRGPGSGCCAVSVIAVPVVWHMCSSCWAAPVSPEGHVMMALTSCECARACLMVMASPSRLSGIIELHRSHEKPL